MAYGMNLVIEREKKNGSRGWRMKMGAGRKKEGSREGQQKMG